MEIKRFSSGSSFEKRVGYSRAVKVGDWIFVSGTTGYDYSTMRISDNIVNQTEQCFKNIISALEEVGSRIEEIVKVTYIIPDATEFEKCWPILIKYFGEVKPAATMISAGLAKPEMKIEIEVTAHKQ